MRFSKEFPTLLAAFALCTSACARAHAQAAPSVAPPPAGVAAEAQRYYAGVKKNILAAAEKMPADAYGYKPEPDIRTFARVVQHVAEAQLRSCGAFNGTAADALPKMPAEPAGKDEMSSVLKASFAECDKAFGSMTDARAVDTVTMGPAKRTRIGVLWGVNAHDAEQYATLALYLRLKGLTPPSSEK